MEIRCIRCKSKFEQQINERTCGCKVIKKYESQKLDSLKWNTKHAHRLYILRMARYFQNPIHQWVREYITTENFTHYETFKKQAKKY